MGDHITDLSETELPPVPPKTYQWEDIRRQRLEGRYPWTHLYKPPFDLETWEKTKEHEYEPVIPMDANRKTPPPFLKVTTATEKPEDDSNPIQDKHHLRVHETDIEEDDENDYEEHDYEEEDDTEEITAAELQNQLEERYFRQSPSSSKHEYELPDTRSPSPYPEQEPKTFQNKVNLQTDKIKQKFKNFKDQISQDSSPGLKRKNDDQKSKPVKKNKFNFRKHNIKLPDRSNFQLPQAPRLSFASLSSFSRSRSNSTSTKERSQSSETDSQKKKFDFGTYPRIFKKKKKVNVKSHDAEFKHKSAPSSPISRRSPFPQRWINKFTDKKEEEKKDSKKTESKKDTVVQESIFISLHEDLKLQTPPEPSNQETTQTKLDDENFIFISLHEERFPEKLKQREEQLENEENDSPLEKKKVETARKFTSLLKKLEIERKLKAKQLAADEKPEPVIITEITDDDGGDTNAINLEDSVESPEDSEENPLANLESVMVIEEYKEKTPTKDETPSTKRKLIDVFKTTKIRERERTPTSAVHSKESSPDIKSKSGTPVSQKKIFFEASPVRDIKPTILFAKNIESTPEIEPNPETPAPKRKEREITESPPTKSETPATKRKEIKETTLERKSRWEILGKRKKETTPTPDKKLKESSPSSEKKDSKKVKEPKKPKELKEPKEPKELVHVNTLKNKIKNIFSKEEPKPKEEKPKASSLPRDLPKRVAINESENQIINDDSSIPPKAPRKKLKKLDSDVESKESLSAFEDPTLNDIIALDEQQPITKTYINASLQEVNDIPVEPEHTIKHFQNYEKALEKSRSHSSIEIDNNLYSANNTLARLETPIPPARPSRTRSLQRPKRTKQILEENKENVYDLEANSNYNTFPIIRPDKPRRKFKKLRTYSNFTNNTDVKSVNEMEDAAISQNIVNSKQLSISFLPLTSNIVGEPIIHYNLRETSSMIHLNLTDPPPLPPKRKKPSISTRKCNTLPNRKFCSKTSSKTSLTESEIYNNLNIQDADFDYVDDANSTIPSDSPPRRPSRKRSAGPSLIDEDRTSREIESLPSEKSIKDDDFDSDSKDINGYAVIGKPQKSHSQPTTLPNSTTVVRRKSRRLSDFFTLPRIRTPTNYVSSTSTLNYERRPNPSRPPRKIRPLKEPMYTNEENINAIVDINFEDEEVFNFNLATSEDDIPEIVEKDKDLQSDDILEKMKTRPLPPPPRPIRKPKDDKYETQSYDYSSVKKNSEIQTNNLSHVETEQKIINVWETNDEKEQVNIQERSEKEEKIINATNEPLESTGPELEQPNAIVSTTEFKEVVINEPTTSSLNIITAERLNVSELNVAKLSIQEIESSRLVTSSVDTSTMQVSDIKSDGGHIVLNSVELSPNLTPLLERSSPNPECSTTRDLTPSSEEPIPETSRCRFSSMIPEVGSDEESIPPVTRVVRPTRRKSAKKEEPANQNVSDTSQATLAELMCQILQICHSSVGQALHSLLEQVIPEDREKRNEVQAAIWVITIIVAGCLILGLQTNEKIVHHHHWDFHFPPPH